MNRCDSLACVLLVKNNYSNIERAIKVKLSNVEDSTIIANTNFALEGLEMYLRLHYKMIENPSDEKSQFYMQGVMRHIKEIDDYMKKDL